MQTRGREGMRSREKEGVASNKRSRTTVALTGSSSAAPVVTSSSSAVHDEEPEVEIVHDEQVDTQRLLDQAIMQVLSAYGSLISSQLDEMVVAIARELKIAVPNLATVFRRLNENLRPLSFEIKTVVLRRSTGEESRYHGLANIEEDAIAKEHGNSFSPAEMAFFQDISVRLVLDNMMSTEDILNLRPEKFLESQVFSLIGRLINQQYLARNERDFVILAPRAYLELGQFLEAGLLQSNKFSEIENPEERRQRLFELLPQLLVY